MMTYSDYLKLFFDCNGGQPDGLFDETSGVLYRELQEMVRFLGEKQTADEDFVVEHLVSLGYNEEAIEDARKPFMKIESMPVLQQPYYVRQIPVKKKRGRSKAPAKKKNAEASAGPWNAEEHFLSLKEDLIEADRNHEYSIYGIDFDRISLSELSEIYDAMLRYADEKYLREKNDRQFLETSCPDI